MLYPNGFIYGGHELPSQIAPIARDVGIISSGNE